MKEQRKSAGFTLVEVLVGMALTMMSMQFCFQLTGFHQMSLQQYHRATESMQIAEAVQNHVIADYPEEWMISESRTSLGNLEQVTYDIVNGGTHWQISGLEAIERGNLLA